MADLTGNISSDGNISANVSVMAQGEKGEKGDKGEPGTNGKDGKAASISIGKVVEGTSMSVSNSGTSTDAVLDFTLIKGEKGDKGNDGKSETPVIISTTLLSSGWSNGLYTINNDKLTATGLITLSLPSDVTSTIYDTVAAAKIVCSSQTDKNIVLKCLGKVPTSDINIILTVVG